VCTAGLAAGAENEECSEPDEEKYNGASDRTADYGA